MTQRYTYAWLIILLSLVLIQKPASAATYYLTSAGAAYAQTPGSWNTNPAGGGNPANNFITDDDIFIVPEGISGTVSSDWNFGYGTSAGKRQLYLEIRGTLTFNDNTTTTLKSKHSTGLAQVRVFEGGKTIFLGTGTRVIGNTGSNANSNNLQFIFDDGAIISSQHPDGVGTTSTVGSINTAQISINIGAVAYEYTGSATLDLGPATINGDLLVGGTTNLTATGALDISGDLIVESGATFNGGSFTHTIAGNIDVDGTFSAGTSTIVMDGATQQSIDVLNHATNPFNNLTVNNAAGVKGTSDLTVNGILNLQSDNPNATDGALDMVVSYGTGGSAYLQYAPTLPDPDADNANSPGEYLNNKKMQAGDLLDSKILYMGPSATTTGIGDVIGKVARTSFTQNLAYSFGNPNTSITFFGAGSLPTEIIFVITKGQTYGLHPNTPYVLDVDGKPVDTTPNDGNPDTKADYNPVERIYQIIRTGGDAPTTINLRLHYRDDELVNTPDPNRFVIWDHHISYGTNNTPHEHGVTSMDLSTPGQKWIQLTGHLLTYLTTGKTVGEQGKYWIIAEKLSADFEWLGPDSAGIWSSTANWQGGALASETDDVYVKATASNSPQIDIANAVAKSITIHPDKTLTINSGNTLTLKGGTNNSTGIGSLSGTGITGASNSNLVFDYPLASASELATFAGSATLHDLTIATDTRFQMEENATITVNNAITLNNNSVFDAGTFINTITYNGTGAVITPNGGDGKYHSLGFGASAAPASVPAAIAMKGNFSNAKQGLSLSSTTISLDGTTQQTMGGTEPASMSGLTVNNAAGVSLTQDQTVSGTLTLTNGVISTSSAALKLGASATIAGTPGASAHVGGKLTRGYSGTGEKEFPIGKEGKYRPVKLNYSDLTGSSDVSVEQFEAAYGVALPAGYESKVNRYWNVTETGSSSRTYTISLTKGDDFNPSSDVLVRILKYNGSSWEIANTSYDSNTGYYTSSTSFTSFSDFVLAEAIITWDGSESKDWNTAANWDLNLVPPTGSSIIIPDVTNQPILSGTASILNCTIESGADLTIATSGKLTVEGTLTNNAGVPGIVIKSDATATGSLIANTAVDVTMERYIAGLGAENWADLLYTANGWHMIASPVAAEAIADEWTPVASGYDFYAWNTITNQWVNKKSTDWSAVPGTAYGDPVIPAVDYGANFNVGQGYLIAYELTPETTRTFTGTIKVNNHAVDSIKSHYFAAEGENPAFTRPWHLIGNPYTSGLSWNNGDWSLNRIAGVAKIWNRENASYSDLSTEGVIPPGNAFMVKVENLGTVTTSGSFVIPASARVHNSGTPAFYKSERTGFQLLVRDLTYRTAQESNFYVHPEATETYDSQFDSDFLPGFGPSFYASVDKYRLSTHVVPELTPDMYIPYHFQVSEPGQFEISITGLENFPEQVWLYDRKWNKHHSLTVSPKYAFSSEEGDAPNRFLVHFGNRDLDEIANIQPVTAWYYQGNLYVRTELSNTQLHLVDMSGQVVLAEQLRGTGLHTIPFTGKPGVFVVRMAGDQFINSQKIVTLQ